MRGPTGIVLLGALTVGASNSAVAQQGRSYTCPIFRPEVKQKVINNLMTQIKRNPYQPCNGTDSICTIAMQFYLGAMGYGDNKVPSGTPWSVIFKCVPELAQVKELNDQALAQREQAKQQQAKIDEQQKEEQQVKENDPKHLLTRSYYDYIVVRKCFEQRKGYVAVNISDEEMDRAKKATKAIEDAVLKSNPNIDKEAVWKAASSDSADWMTDGDQADSIMSRYDSRFELDQSDRNRCQKFLKMLEGRLSKIAPEANAVRKDF